MANAVSALIGIMLAVVVGVAVTIPVVVQAITDANLTGTTATIVNLIPLLIGVLLIVIVVSSSSLNKFFEPIRSYGFERSSYGISSSKVS